ncbi:unnamed protein product [Blepharisma stoltei]|uniref:Major facilitator superfamily (MFS) profile domain-containing protein n=1 Tax=Blepharisma stoltei TaxID=1481888 RepID=A0AAU9KEH1_9CILI|nr:unnamed protein product [Blepharisma stoltei]
MNILGKNWIMLFLYFCLNFINGAVFCAFSSISEEAEKYYNANEDQITMFITSFMITSIASAPITPWILSKSYHWTMMASWISAFVGCWVKYLAGHDYYIALFGQFIFASTNMLILCGCLTLAFLWFQQEDQGIAIAVGSISNFIGMGTSFILGPYVKNIPILNLSHAVFSTIVTSLNILCSSKDPLKRKESDMLRGAITLIKDPMMMCIVFCSGSGIGISYALIGVLSLILEHNGITMIQVGWLGFIMSFSGLTGGLIASYIAMRYNSVLWSLRVFLIMSIASIMVWASLDGDYIVSIFGSMIVGFGLIGHIPLGIRAALQQNSKLEESIPSNMIFFLATLFGLIYTYPIISFYELSNLSALWMIGILTSVSFGIFFIISYKIPNTQIKIDDSSTLNSENPKIND